MIYIKRITNIKPEYERKEYPYNIPAIRNLNEFEFKSNVTFIIGENGTGKSAHLQKLGG